MTGPSSVSLRASCRAGRAFLILLIGGGLGTPARAQEADELPGFEDVTEVVEVEVPVNVLTRDGEPVRGLGVEDFRVLDNGEPQEIVGFRVVDLELIEPGATRTEIERAVPASARRHFLFLFDLSFSQPHALLRAREAARRFALERLHPTDLVAVATHTIEDGARLIVTFTPDRAQVARAVDTLGAPKLLQFARRDPLQFFLEDPGTIAQSASSDIAEGDGGFVGAMQQNVLEHLRIIGKEMAKTEKSFLRGRISSWSRSMAELARYLGSVRGRKHVVYFSEGWDGRLLLGRQPAADDRETQEDLFNIATGQLHLVDTDNIYGNTLLQTDMELMLEEFRRADCVIEAVDIAGLRADSSEEERARSVGQDALFYVANETGGNLFQDANDFGDQLARVMQRSMVTYLIAFRPSDLAHDGAFHRIKVEVDTPGPSRLSARDGYYAPRPWSELHPFEKNLLAADAIASPTADGAVQLDVLTAAFKAAPGLAYVPVIIEVEGDSLLEGQRDAAMPVELYSYATNADGEMKDFFTQLVSLDLSTTRGAFAQAGLKYYGHLELEPGSYLLRVLVRNGATGRSGLAIASLEVPAYDAAEPVLLPPFFVEADRRWFMVRETAPTTERTVVYPFTVNGEPYVPAAHPVLGRGAESVVCLVGYNLGAEPVIDGHVVAADGRVLEPVGLAGLERTVTGIAGLDKFLATVSADGLERGTYALRVALTDPATGATRVTSVPFTVH
jgi:VWFA-related protein